MPPRLSEDDHPFFLLPGASRVLQKPHSLFIITYKYLDQQHMHSCREVGAEHQLPHQEAQQRMHFLWQLKKFNLPMK